LPWKKLVTGQTSDSGFDPIFSGIVDGNHLIVLIKFSQFFPRNKTLSAFCFSPALKAFFLTLKNNKHLPA